MKEEHFGIHLALSEFAIRERRVLLVKYVSPASGVRSEREIEPWGIYFAQNQWMLVAFCRLKKAKRKFRLDGVVSLAKTSNTFPPHQFNFD